MAKAKVAECRNCRRPGRVHRTHRLCVDCYQLRVLWDAAAVPDEEDEGMSEAELDAMIAEQMRPENLPEWWERDVRKQQRRGVKKARKEFGRLLWGKRA